MSDVLRRDNFKVLTSYRIERYSTAASTPAPQSPLSAPRSNPFSGRLPYDNSQHTYQQFPAQASRIPPSQTQPQQYVDTTAPQAQAAPYANGNANEVTPPRNVLPPKEAPWSAVEGLTGAHLTGSEPRIFPGVVSRSHRRSSSARQGSMSENDDHSSVSTIRRNNATGEGVGVGVEEALNEEEAE